MTAFLLWEIMGGGLFFVLGMAALAAKKPVQFWTVDQYIQVSDVKKYNHAVARLWIVAALIMLLLGIPLLKGQNSPWILITVLGGMFCAISLMVIYTRIEKKYRIY